MCQTEKRWLEPGFDPKGKHELPEGWVAQREYDRTKALCCDRGECRELFDEYYPDGHDLELLRSTELNRYPLIIGLIKTEWGKDELERSIRRGKKSLPDETIRIDPRKAQPEQDDSVLDNESG
jgi:hypothetical protein